MEVLQIKENVEKIFQTTFVSEGLKSGKISSEQSILNSIFIPFLQLTFFKTILENPFHGDFTNSLKSKFNAEMM